jgi:hypothetical protein
VLIDPHGDLVDEVARQKLVHHPKHGIDPNDLKIIDPTLMMEHGRFITINPFQYQFRHQEQVETYAQMLARVFTAMLKGG